MFLYYFPKTGGKFAVPDSIAYCKDRGASINRREVLQGPNGSGAGWVISIGDWPAESVGYYPDRQTWAELPGTPTEPPLYVGRMNDATLDPGRLARPAMLDGHPVELGDGSVWMAAVARGFDTEASQFYTPLPKSLTYDPTSNRWRPKQVAKEYRRFLELAISYGDAHDTAVAEGKTQFDFAEIDELAILALQCNYRIGPAELSLFDDVYTVPARTALVEVALDFPTIRKWAQKKTESAGVGSDTSVGNGQ
jgi:hypothetical protein